MVFQRSSGTPPEASEESGGGKQVNACVLYILSCLGNKLREQILEYAKELWQIPKGSFMGSKAIGVAWEAGRQDPAFALSHSVPKLGTETALS